MRKAFLTLSSTPSFDASQRQEELRLYAFVWGWEAASQASMKHRLARRVERNLEAPAFRLREDVTWDAP